MKRQLLTVLFGIVASLCLVFGITACSDSDDKAQPKPTEGFEYTLSSDGTYYTLSGIGTVTESNVLIPSTYQGLPVGAIGDKVFLSCTSLTSVVIPDSVTSIGNAAFSGCSSLEILLIGEGVKDIAENAFYYCTALKNIYFNAITCNDLNYNNHVFCNAGQNSKGITVTIGANVTKIPAYMFCPSDSSYTPNIVNIVFEDGSVCTSIGNYAFAYCTSLESISMSDSITNIGTYAFYGCTTEINWGDDPKITTIGGYAFSYYAGTSITIPNSVTSISSSAFYGCSSLTSITIPDNVTSIGSAAFGGCSSLKSIILPFVGGSSSESSASNSTLFGYIFGTSSYTGGTSTTQYYGSSSATYYIPTSLVSVTITGGKILNGAFYKCSNLTSITLGIGVTEIDRKAFYDCSNITNITIPDRVTSIGSSAFFDCTSLESVTIGSSVTSIGKNAFRYCRSLTSITIPDSVTSIGINAFARCTSLTSVMFKNTEGWWHSSSSSATSGTSISSADLADPATAATYLKSTYSNYYWKRS